MTQSTASYCIRCGAHFVPTVVEREYCSRSCRLDHWLTKHPRHVLPLPSKPELVSEQTSQPESVLEQASELVANSKPASKPTLALLSQPAPAVEVVPDDDDDLDWALRGDYWEALAAPTTTPLTGRYTKRQTQANRPALALAGHGVRLSVDRGTLVVRSGYTHYPQERQEYRYFAGDRHLPARIILCDNDGVITLDAMQWLSAQHVPLVQLDWRGLVVSVTSQDVHITNFTLYQAQVQALSTDTGLRIASRLIQDKIIASATTLRTLPATPARTRALQTLHGLHETLGRNTPDTTASLRLIEGQAAHSYFSYWRGLVLRWRSTPRYPLPDSWQSIGLRESSLSGLNRRAAHPVNAMLNYAYAVLESQLRVAIALAGLDASISYLHAIQTKRLSLVYDVMEPLRPQLDRLVLDFLLTHVFHPADFLIMTDGAVQLHPQLARVVAGITLPDSAVQQVVRHLVDWLHEPTTLSVTTLATGAAPT